jgi:hypothetical protein
LTGKHENGLWQTLLSSAALPEEEKGKRPETLRASGTLPQKQDHFNEPANSNPQRDSRATIVILGDRLDRDNR